MKILIVDDDAAVLQAIMSVVRAVPGHDVKVAANAQKAHEHAATMGGVDLLITDVVMEPTNGFELRAELQSAHPAMQTIYITGFDLSDYADAIAGVPVLMKPVDAMAIITGIGTAAAQMVAPVKAAVPEKARVAGKTTSIALPAGATVPVPTPAAQPKPAAPAPVPQPATAVQEVPNIAPPAQPSAPAPSEAPAPAVVVAAVPAVAAPVMAASPVAAPASAAEAKPDFAHDPLLGVQLGDYRVQQVISEGRWGRVYLALQLSVNRRVGLKVLEPALGEDQSTKLHFMNDARAKAAVQHPSIVSVFEADERNGLAFFTQEFIDGASMQEMIASGRQLDEKTALHVLKVAAESLQYLWSRNLSHSLVDADSLRLGADKIARMANLATADMDPRVSVEAELQIIGSMIQRLTKPENITPGLNALLARMTGGANPVSGWPVVVQAVKALEPKVIPVEAARMKAADEVAMRAIEAARKARKKALIVNLCTLSALVVALVYVVWKFVLTNARKLDDQVEIPAGSYPVGEPGAGKATLGAYEIDKYEVTIGEYAKFIEWCQNNSAREHEFDHMRGDKKTSHLNEEVIRLISKAKQRGSRVFKQDPNRANNNVADPGVEVDLNCPMIGVTFWDAYAYARWRGKILEGGAPRDLPTEEEWEAAARGSRGYKYPWGEEMKPKNFNSNQGYKPLSPGGTKTDDGFNYWAPVDEFGGDVSEFKVVGMAGNVCEWVYRKEGIREIPLLKGGSFATDPMPMWGRILKIPAEDCWFVHPASEKKPAQRGGAAGEAYYVGDDVLPTVRSLYIGFRTVKRK